LRNPDPAIPVLIAIASLLLLWAFVVWERHRPVEPVARDAMARGWSPRTLLRWPVWAALAVCCAGLGAVAWLQPSTGPLTGRLSFVMQAAHALWGAQGPACVWWAAACAFAAGAAVAYRKRSRLDDINTSC